MIDKPIHRRQLLVSSDKKRSATWKFWLLPSLLFVQAVFVGSTFNTLATTLGAFLFAVLVAGFFLQWIGGHNAAPDRNTASDAETLAVRGGSKKAPDARTGTEIDRKARLGFWPFIAVTASVFCVAGIGAALRVGYHMAGNLNPVAMIVDSISHAVFLVALTLWVFYPRRGHPAMLACGLLLVLTTVTAGGVSHTISGQLVAALATVFGFSIAADYILGHWQDAGQSRSTLRRKKRLAKSKPVGTKAKLELPASTVSISTDQGRSPLLFSALALSVLLMSTSAAGHLAANVVPGLQLGLFDRLSQSLEAVTSTSIIGGTRYVRGSRLGSVRRHMIGDPADPALRAFSVTAPGYLRGTVFDSYKDGAWSPVSERRYLPSQDTSSLRSRPATIQMPGQIEVRGRVRSQLERFGVRKNSGRDLVGTVEVHNVPMKGQLVFSSLSTDWIEAATFDPRISHHDMVINGVDTQEPYILGICTDTPQENLSRVRKDVMLDLNAGLKRKVQPIAMTVCDGRLTARAKARAIEDYFQANYTYSLRGTAAPRNTDPVVHFLDAQHPSHCEYFASAAALMLRSVDVPTRYVTGYVLKEKSENGDYWIARNRDAHAWVEAYDEITERWFPVEATVGRTYRTLMTEEDLFDEQGGASDGFLDSEDDGSLIGMVLGWLLSFRATDSLTFLFRVAQLPLFCMVVALLWVRHRQKLRTGGDPMEFESRQMLHRVDRQVRKHLLVRAPSETLHQFASRVESAGTEKTDGSTFLQDAAQWYRRFAVARYRGLMPVPMDAAG